MKIKYEDFNFRAGTLATIDQANKIITEYEAQGFKLTVRQLYYQFVARDLIENSQRSYKRLVGVVGNGRMAGLIDWNAIEDRTRNLASLSHWTSPASIINSAAWGFRIDKWKNQPNRIEVWIEKEALAGVIEPVCNRLDVAFMSCRGYMSLSEMHEAGKRLARYAVRGQDVHILHLGDHDPSGIDMTRDIEDRVTLFAEGHVGMNRLALNFHQIEEFNPPPNFAKMSDSRYADYAAQYGTDSWELDALDPVTLADLIEVAVLELRDDDQWYKDAAEEKQQKDALQLAADNWETVAEYVQTI